MAKKQDFASKTLKLAKHGKVCPVCGEVYTHVVKVDLVTADKSSSYRFNQQNIGVCKCNEKEVYA